MADVGTVYVGCMTGPAIIDEHVAQRATNLLDVAGLGPVSVAVTLRSAAFRSSCGSISPNPVVVHTMVQEDVQAWITRCPLALPEERDLSS